MALAGNLRNIPLLEVLRIVNLARSTGGLTVKSSAGKAQINFHLGEIVFAGIENHPLRVGEVLVDQHYITEEQLQKVIVVQRNTKPWKPMGMVSVELGYITMDDLKEVITYLITQMVTQMALWKEGIFRFEEKEVTLNDQIAVNMRELIIRSSEGIKVGVEQFFEKFPNALQTDHQLAEMEDSSLAPEESSLENLEENVEQFFGSHPFREKEESESIFHVYQEVSKLREMLVGLRDGKTKGEISLLLLRFASEFFQRVILLFIQNENLIGLGHFGLDSQEKNIDQLVRKLVIPLEDNIFSQTLHQKKMYTGVLPAKVWEQFLNPIMGNPPPAQCVLIPIWVLKEARLFLYGDNGTEPITQDLNTLQLFSQQVGMAFEIAFLSQK